MHLSFRTSPPYGGRRHSLNIVELNSVTALWKNCIYCIINDSKSGNNWFINKHTHTHKFSCETAQMLNLWNKIKQNKSRGEKAKKMGTAGYDAFQTQLCHVHHAPKHVRSDTLDRENWQTQKKSWKGDKWKYIFMALHHFHTRGVCPYCDLS